MDLGIKGRVALVGASGRGLGLATAKRLAMEGCAVALCDLDEEALAAGVKSVLEEVPGAKAKGYPVDLTKADSIKKLVDSARADLGPISILVTNSGGPPPGTFDMADDDKWQFGYDITFLSAVRLIRNVLPDMKEQKWGRIINFTSRSLKEPVPNLIISNAVRLAVVGMAKTLAEEVASFGITVNNIGPGVTSTDRAIELAGARAAKKGISPEEELKQTMASIPLGRLARPEEQASVAAFLASEEASYITGVSLLVDGGAVRAI